MTKTSSSTSGITKAGLLFVTISNAEAKDESGAISLRTRSFRRALANTVIVIAAGILSSATIDIFAVSSMCQNASFCCSEVESRSVVLQPMLEEFTRAEKLR